MQEPQILDEILLGGYISALGKALVQQMLELYIQQSIVYLDEIKEVTGVELTKVWQEKCHKMKGAAASVGMTLVYGKLASIEKSVQSPQEKEQMLIKLHLLNQQAISHFSSWLDTQQ